MMCGARAKFCQRYKGGFCDGSFPPQAGQKAGMMMLRGSVNTNHPDICNVQR